MKPKQGSSVATIASCLLHHPDKPTATSRGRDWRGATIDVHDGVKNFQVDAPELDHHAVVYVPHGVARILQQRAGKSHEGIVRKGSVMLIPAGLPCKWRGSSSPTIRMRVPLELVTSALEQAGPRSSSKGELINVFHTRDLFVEQIATLFAAELETPSHPAQALIAEAASYALAAHMVRRYDAFAPGGGQPSCGLSPRTLNRVIDYLESSLASSMTLEDLAVQAGVSKFHFARMFKVSMGISPMAYLERMRLKQSEVLIREGKLSLSQVARAVGFSSQRYFCRRFVNTVGCSPSDYARDHCLRRDLALPGSPSNRLHSEAAEPGVTEAHPSLLLPNERTFAS